MTGDLTKRFGFAVALFGVIVAGARSLDVLWAQGLMMDSIIVFGALVMSGAQLMMKVIKPEWDPFGDG